MDARVSPPTAPVPGDAVAAFVTELIRAGVVLAEVLDNLLDAVAQSREGGAPDAEELLGMLVNSLHGTVAAAGEDVLRAVTPLFDACVRRTLEELEHALAHWGEEALM
jgi:hypothetical protein